MELRHRTSLLLEDLQAIQEYCKRARNVQPNRDDFSWLLILEAKRN